ncbi:MAG: 4-hydroxythreonine-4-phosphate dehydrogenase PdxA [Bacteroidetes bacterium]|nr:MAG: 4-hydroxythreonine-4-phosphate dehydrogenase PdxA [Bacteroidota bacterium]REK03411.1 MAG: 4-hydroxythreonine-4-phosphate dehydrogenase PdxA [Bacteroidota bacterium]REK34477.1 MAG: 4-hydroxythreonine-4-phosphate dehydrogenase PdxA [Bacteroidota bacterium]REK50405.1 MAG: 4-hydroxythreonine-4-phosphate dehydrogenase PdxA [Bacteroidota bacterium]
MSHPENEGRIKVGISCGDINGIGLEVVMKALLDNRIHQLFTPVIYASNKLVSLQRKALNLNDFQYQTVKSSNEIILRKNNVINCWEEEVQVEWGKATESSGKYAYRSLEAAVADLKNNKIDVLVTAPINKHNIQHKDFQFQGHTEYLSDRFSSPDHLMFLVSDSLKVAVVSGHVPVKQVAQELSIDKIRKKLMLMDRSLKRDFGIRKPRIAVLGLNPHAGDEGLIGMEEKDIIIPAIKKAFDDGIFVYGPYSADGFFGSAAFRKFDAVLAMYHDQGLVPFKTLSFSSGVNFTAGLPIVRTSPDHGTAYDIAGKGQANEESIRDAMYCAIDILKKREEYDEINANPLAFSKQGRDQ